MRNDAVGLAEKPSEASRTVASVNPVMRFHPPLNTSRARSPIAELADAPIR